MVTEAARAGDPAAGELFDEIGSWLGTGLANLAAAFDPEVIVVGGGVSEAGDLLLDPAREALRKSLTGRGFRPEPPVVRAALGPDAGFIGAATARARESGAPTSLSGAGSPGRNECDRLQSLDVPGDTPLMVMATDTSATVD